MLSWLKGTLAQIAQLFSDTVSSVLDWISDLFVNIFKSIWDLLSDLICWVIDKLMSIVVSASNSVSFDGLQGFAPAGSLPSEILNVMQLCGVGSAVSIIVTAIGVRLTLQLIPFTRLGS